MNLSENIEATTTTYALLNLENKHQFKINGNSKSLLGNNKVVHLMRIHNSSGTISNLTFSGGNTYTLKNIKRNHIIFRKPKGSIFEIIDGGAVVISGESEVSFINCRFENNKSLMCGGAISNQSTKKVIFNKCIFKDNSTGHTGAAIDNLIAYANIEVNNCIFEDNLSNTWNNQKGPHGQITVFPKTQATIKNCRFHGGSIPFDYESHEDIKLKNNTYTSIDMWNNWKEDIPLKRYKNIIKTLSIGIKLMYWLPFKVKRNSYYRVNKSF